MKKKLVVEKVTDIDNLPALSKKQEDMFAKLKDRAVDTSDIPELSEDFWKNLQIGVFYRPVKKHISVKLDADIIAWLKKDGKGYQTRMNAMLRELMIQDIQREKNE